MRYSIIKVIVNDWPALASSIGIPIIWAIHLVFPYISTTQYHQPLWFPFLVTCGLIILITWRIQRIAWFFANGESTSGNVVILRIVKDRGRIEFTFHHKGNKITSWSPVHKTKTVLSLVPGTSIEVLYDKEEPRRAVIKELYAP
ncbi:hypothetical protein [Sulfurovum sp.]|uniref:hypothetical protein n=1 Tax=Sulfurovum sp. TaxID=1969726 RepID=UPI003568DC16